MAQLQASDLPKEMGVADVRHFHEHGFVLVRHFLSAEAARGLREKVEEYVAASQPTQVRWIASHFDTFNGAAVDKHFPQLQTMYDHLLLKQLQRFDPRLATLTERSVGLSVNITPLHGKFQPHFDRNRLTAVLYANDDYVGGQMLIYPRIRFWLGSPGGWIQRKAQRLLDKYVRRQTYLDAYARQTVIQPQAGDLLIFEGNRTYHAVTPVTQGHRRISIQFAYDHAGTVFDISEYYGKAKPQSSSATLEQRGNAPLDPLKQEKNNAGTF